MPSPSTHQDSPKVPEWPTLRMLSFDRKGFSVVSDSGRKQAEKHNDPRHLETYIPVSALLSDEVVEAVKRRWFEASQEFHGDETLVARALIQAAIEQVGGGQGA